MISEFKVGKMYYYPEDPPTIVWLLLKLEKTYKGRYIFKRLYHTGETITFLYDWSDIKYMQNNVVEFK